MQDSEFCMQDSVDSPHIESVGGILNLEECMLT
jgi:hypothetical protein